MLHREDAPLINRGRGIAWSELVTFVKGEPAWDPAQCKVIALASDMVKIKGREGVHVCIFYDASVKGCSIYERRPLECRTLKCWDTEEIEALFLKDMLSRKDICRNHPEVLSRIYEYDSLYGVEAISPLLEQYDGPGHPQVTGLSEDAATFRSRAVHELGLDHGAADFIFGRPLKEVMDGLFAARRYGL